MGGAHQGGHLVVYNLDYLLGGGKAGQDLLSHRLFGDGFYKILGHLIVNIGLQKGQADVGLAELTPVFQLLKRSR